MSQRNSLRRTRRRGAPQAQPDAILRATRDPVRDAADRADLGLRPEEPLATWTIVGPVLARGDQPDHRVELTGIPFDASIPAPTGFIYPSIRASPIDGRRMLVLRARVYWRDSKVYGQLVWGQTSSPDGEARSSVEGADQARNRYEIEMAERGLDLLLGKAPRGRIPDGREQELNRLAALGLRWLCAERPKGRDIDDLTWPILARLDLDRPLKKLEAKANKLDIRIVDVRQRVVELERWQPEEARTYPGGCAPRVTGR